MRRPALSFLFVVTLLLSPAAAGEPPGGAPGAAKTVLEALNAERGCAFTQAVANDDATVKAIATTLVGHPASVQTITARHLERQKDLVKRDGDSALVVADWLVRLAADTHKQAAKDPVACAAVWQANLARARIGLALDKPVLARHWTTAADARVGHQTLLPADKREDAAYVDALAILREGAAPEKAPLRSLVDHAARVCGRLLKAVPKRLAVRRAIADSYVWQSEVHEGTSRKGAQAALHGYFEAFAPLAQCDDAEKEDVLAWNRMVSVVRRAKLKVKTDYIARRCLGAGGQLSYWLPRTGSWAGSGVGPFSQKFKHEELSRDVSFDTYLWNQHYGARNSPRDVKGDNLKGVAQRTYDMKLDILTSGRKPAKIKKKSKPRRARFNKTLPSGIEFTLEYVRYSGERVRMRCFFVKSVKAEISLQITILEAAELRGDDPEWQDIIDSFDITKKKR